MWHVEELRTSRLLLRPHRLTDAADLLAFHSDPDVVRYTPWPVRDRAQVEAALAKKLDQARAEGPNDPLVLAIEFDGTVIGEVLFKRGIDGHAELGYALSRSYWGRGLASEAVVALLQHGAAVFGLRHVTATLDSRNAASVALLERLGFVLAGSGEREFKSENVLQLEYALEL